eukprot:1170981-Pleurochrysis_carterae.AAC.1
MHASALGRFRTRASPLACARLRAAAPSGGTNEMVRSMSNLPSLTHLRGWGGGARQRGEVVAV